jgi:hypothetical protein
MAGLGRTSAHHSTIFPSPGQTRGSLLSEEKDAERLFSSLPVFHGSDEQRDLQARSF